MLNRFFLILIFAFTVSIAGAQNSISLTSLSHTQSLIALEPAPNAVSTNYSLAHFNYVMEKSNKQHPLVKTGKILTFIGIPLTIAGAIMVSNADELYYNCYNGDCEGDQQGAFGVLLLASGIGLSGTGITLWIIGKNKS